MSKEEWDNIKQHNLVESSTQLFGTVQQSGPSIEPTPQQLRVTNYAKAVAKKLLGLDIRVCFLEDRNAANAASFGLGMLNFNVGRLPTSFFSKPVSKQTTDLIIHELAHSAGNHTEKSYHECATRLGAQLTMLALEDPDFFEQF